VRRSAAVAAAPAAPPAAAAAAPSAEAADPRRYRSGKHMQTLLKTESERVEIRERERDKNEGT